MSACTFDSVVIAIDFVIKPIDFVVIACMDDVVLAIY
jgi:hypothetical protein